MRDSVYKRRSLNGAFFSYRPAKKILFSTKSVKNLFLFAQDHVH